MGFESRLTFFEFTLLTKIVERSKKGAAERGAENYVRQIETEAMALRTEGTILHGTYSIKTNGNLCSGTSATCSESEEIRINMNGIKPKGGTVQIEHGKVVSTGTSLTIEDYAVTINENGSATAAKVEEDTAKNSSYYSWGTGQIGGSLPSDADSDLSKVVTDGYPYLKIDSADGETIDAAYACFQKDGKKYCLKGNDTEAYSANEDIIKEAFKEVLGTSSCFDDEDGYRCQYGSFDVFAYPDGMVGTTDYHGLCYISDNDFECCKDCVVFH